MKSNNFAKLNFAQQMDYGAIHAKLPIYKKRLDETIAAIIAMQSVSPNSYLSLSFGKQSIILAHLLYQIQPEIPCYFLASDETWIMHNFAEVIQQFCSRIPINLQIVQTNHIWLDGDDWETSRGLGHRDLQNLASEHEWDGWYWGLNKEESKIRRITLSLPSDSPHPLIYRYKSQKYRCCPLGNWQLEDIAAYVGMHDIPLLDIYHQIGLQARTTARLTKKSAEWGGLSALRQTNLAAYQVLCDRFPELRNFQIHQ